MSKQAAAGIRSILDDILSSQKPQNQVSPKVDTPTISKTDPKPPDKPCDHKPPVAARRGRPVGKSIASAPPKEKVTLWLTVNLIAAYRDWSWEARCPLSHLVEQALSNYLASRNT